MAKKELKIYSVNQINALIKIVLEENLPPRLIITGEITNWSIAASGHVYFSLKDEYAQIPCVMWKSSFTKTKFEPENGLAVLATGHVDTYSPQGKYQFYVDRLSPAGIGNLQLAFEQMKKRLESQGLFDDEHKKPLPQFPMRIGILTSRAGAALGDIKDSIHNRWPCAKLFLYPVPVQGEGAAEKIADAIKTVNLKNKTLKLDLLIVGRGGGSLEDLWAFNEESLARAIFNSEIPIISAVGHEVDVTIADLVADARASTPTKAGVIAVPDIREIEDRLDNIETRLALNVVAYIKLAQQKLQTLCASSVFKNPLLGILNRTQQLDELGSTLNDSIKNFLTTAKAKLQNCFELLIKIEPHRLLKNKTLQLSGLENQIKNAVTNSINRLRLDLTAQENRLAAMNPKSVLNRGYSITTNKKTGLLIKTLDDIETGDTIITELTGENLIESEVKNKQNRG